MREDTPVVQSESDDADSLDPSPEAEELITHEQTFAPTLALEYGGEERTWTDSTGKFKVQATLAGFDNKTVRLKKKDGKPITIPIEKLSQADQEYVRSSAKQSAKAKGGG